MNAPKELVDLDIWMCWAHRGDGPNRTKVPMNAVTGGYGSSTDPGSWTDYETAMTAYRDHAPDFEGMAFAISYHLAVIDLDHCRDPETGAIEKWAQSVIDEFDTYAEVSPSGTGVHIIMFAKDAEKITGTKFVLPQGGGRRVELYNQSHYFTFTANPLPGHGGAVTEQSAAFEKLRERIAAAQEKARNAPKRSGPARRSGPADHDRRTQEPGAADTHDRGASGLTDQDVLKVAYASAHGETIKRLMEGDQSDYRNDWSSADMALCGFLAFYTGKDADQIDRIFRTSGLMRDKWDSKRAGSTYGWFTIDKAIAGTADSYAPGGEEYKLKRPKAKTREAVATDLPDDLAAMKWALRLDGVEEQAIQWVWKDRIPRGMIGMIDGNPGDGKSTIIADIVARVTTGRDWPDGSPSIEGGAIIVGAEDHLNSVWVPRLKAAGARADRVYAVQLIEDPKTGERRMPRLPDDVPLFERLIALSGAVVIVFDPIMPYISGELNANTDQHVRQALTPLAEAAERHMVTPILLRHYAKNAVVANAIYRGLGSIGFIGLSRWGMAVARVPKTKYGPNGQVFSLMQQKTSIGTPQRAYRYTIKGHEWAKEMTGEIIRTSAIEWGELADDDPDAMLTAEGQTEKKGETAGDLLKDILANGPVKSTDILERFDKAGISRRTAFRAREDLQVGARRGGGLGLSGEWFWHLPEHRDMPLPSLRVPSKSANGTLSATKSAKPSETLGTLSEPDEENQVQNTEKEAMSAESSYVGTLSTEEPVETPKSANAMETGCEHLNYEVEGDMRTCDDCGYQWVRA